MKISLSRILVVALLSGGVIAVNTGCSATRTQKSAGEVVDDAVITTKVKAALAADPKTNAFDINVDTFRGTVQLSGFVNSSGEATEATRVAKAVNGVSDVKNNLQVKTSQ